MTGPVISTVTPPGLSSDPRWIGGNKRATLSARVVDLYNNGVPNQPVIFSKLLGDGRL